MRWFGQYVVIPLAVEFVAIVAAAVFAIKFIPELTEWLQPPTCSNPRNLELVPPTDVQIRSSDIGRPADESVDPDVWSADSLMDGDTTTSWVPADNVGSTLAFDFVDGPIYLALVCVVNGKPSSLADYQNAGMLRSVKVETNESDRPRVSPLAIFPPDAMQQRQSLNFDEGETDNIDFEITSSYAGIGVFDPENGQWSNATGNIALAEIEFYRKP